MLACDIPDSPDMQDWLMNYFPVVLRQRYAKEIARHRLHREIIAMAMANSLINRMGPTFIKAITKKTGAHASDIAKAYIIVREIFELRKLWDAVEALDNKVPAELQLKAMREIAHLAEYAVTWLLTRLGNSADIGREIKNYGKAIQELRANAHNFLPDGLKSTIGQRLASYQRDGLPPELAQEIAFLPALSSACYIIRISLENKTELMTTARAYFDLGEQFHLDWLRQQARYMNSEDPWQVEATDGLIDQLYGCQAGLTLRILRDMGKDRATKTKSTGKAESKEGLVSGWMREHAHEVKPLEPFFAQLKRAGTVELSMLVIAEQRLRHLCAG